MKKLFTIGFFFLFIFFLVKTYYYCTDGFRVQKISFDLSEEQRLPQKALDEKILAQDFHYLGKGRQAYVFISEDQKYVVKFLRTHKYQKPLWADLFSSFLLEKQHVMLGQQKQREQRALSSYLIAQEKLNDFSHIAYLHLEKTQNLLKQIVLYDPIKQKHILDLDDFYFLIQKTAIPLPTSLLALYKNQEISKIEKLLESFMQMVISRMEKNIANRDVYSYMRNTGVCGDQVMEMDVGSFYVEKNLQTSLARKEEFSKSIDHLEKFLQENMPSLFPFFVEQREKFLQKL